MHRNEVVTSTASFSELHENETTLSVSEPREYEETVIVVPQPSPPVELVTAESAISDEVSTHVQDSGLSILVPEILSINAQGKMFCFILNRNYSVKNKNVYSQMGIKSETYFFLFVLIIICLFWFFACLIFFALFL